MCINSGLFYFKFIVEKHGGQQNKMEFQKSLSILSLLTLLSKKIKKVKKMFKNVEKWCFFVNFYVFLVGVWSEFTVNNDLLFAVK